MTMKKSAIIPLLFVLQVIVYMACKKENSDARFGSVLQATKTNSIKQGEPVVFSMSRVTGDSVQWSTNPAGYAQIISNGNKATIMFGRAGSFRVRALSGGLVDSTTV